MVFINSMFLKYPLCCFGSYDEHECQNNFLIIFFLLFKCFLSIKSQISLLEGAIANCGVTGNKTSFFFFFFFLRIDFYQKKIQQNLIAFSLFQNQDQMSVFLLKEIELPLLNLTLLNFSSFLHAQNFDALESDQCKCRICIKKKST